MRRARVPLDFAVRFDDKARTHLIALARPWPPNSHFGMNLHM
ncbi:hypothetical protein J3A64_001609 [Pseudarthrobacter sp. PvP004]|nr:hypothetical protein [Pseudarthrobacter sp. PvP004]